MSRRLFVAAAVLAVGLLAFGGAARAAAPTSIAAFTAGAREQPGLFPIWHKAGGVYLEVRKDQLDRDFLETITTGSGLGGGVVWGDTDYLPSELVRFERRGDSIAIVWPNWYAIAPGSASGRRALASNFPSSVVGLARIAAEDASSGTIVFDASSLLDDQMDLRNFIDGGLPTAQRYRRDSALSYFDTTKAFPDNDLLEVVQTWTTRAEHVIDTAPDAQRVAIKVVYNFTQLPHDNYRPRLADDRVGIYDDIYLDFAHGHGLTRKLRYIVRWNFDPAHPGRPSKALHPMVFYLSDTIPPRYRRAISDAILAWNAAFEKIGILDAIAVRPQPKDPSWDPDDVRYNVIRWVAEARPSFGADSQTLFDPRTGEEIRTGVLVSADSALFARMDWKYLVDPVRYGRDTDPVPASFVHDALFAELLHETGHNMGLQHNFTASQAYTAKDLQSPAFTRKYGVTASAMEYAPINLWPRGYGQGTYFQTTLGPYDYHAIEYGYGYIANAPTPQAELPTLRRLARAWSNPRYRYESDEDVSWYDGHAADPRAEQEDLTDHTLAWCAVQLKMYRGLMNTLNAREPHAGRAFGNETRDFAFLLNRYDSCATMPAHWIGGQYLSRAHLGDPNARPPIQPVPLAQEKRAFAMLEKNLFSSAAWHFSPSLLDRLSYSEWAGYGFVSWNGYGNLPTWAYDPPARHDFPVVEQIGRAQMAAIDYMLQPLVLQRVDENSLEATAPTMSIDDLFDWLQTSIYGDLGAHGLRDIPLVRRNLQADYAARLVELATKPAKGTPPDARSLARLELQNLHDSAARDLHDRSLDLVTRAHLFGLVHRTEAALRT
ncbi:MAG: zinc-dependent metalloprotease [Vulcanimicrobiaceae bacterium]